jgi:hypothetical protein
MPNKPLFSVPIAVTALPEPSFVTKRASLKLATLEISKKAAFPELLVAKIPVPLMLLADTPNPFVPLPYTPDPFTEDPYTPEPLPPWDPQTPLPLAPVPLLIPLNPADEAPGAADEIVPITPNAFAFVEEFIPSKADPVPWLVIEIKLDAELPYS